MIDAIGSPARTFRTH